MEIQTLTIITISYVISIFIATFLVAKYVISKGGKTDLLDISDHRVIFSISCFWPILLFIFVLDVILSFVIKKIIVALDFVIKEIIKLAVKSTKNK